MEDSVFTFPQAYSDILVAQSFRVYVWGFAAFSLSFLDALTTNVKLWQKNKSSVTVIRNKHLFLPPAQINFNFNLMKQEICNQKFQWFL